MNKMMKNLKIKIKSLSKMKKNKKLKKKKKIKPKKINVYLTKIKQPNYYSQMW